MSMLSSSDLTMTQLPCRAFAQQALALAALATVPGLQAQTPAKAMR